MKTAKASRKQYIRRTLSWTFGILLLFGGIGYGYYRYQYPYGLTHRCSIGLMQYLIGYAEEHDGKFPTATEPDHLGMAKLLDWDAVNPNQFESLLGMIVGKAGDLDAARVFYRKHGYLRPEHSSWHYVEGMTTTAAPNKAIAWDKIPLSHDGGRMKSNPREVILARGEVQTFRQDQWDRFLKRQSD